MHSLFSFLFPFPFDVASFCCLPVFSSSYQVKQCADFYNVSAKQLAEAVAQTNEYYGAYNIRSSRIVFPNGSIDPWHVLGITRNISTVLPAVFINGEKELCPTVTLKAEFVAILDQTSVLPS